jgi:RNA polymerase sigma-70 factor, ECF subfamily
LAISIALKEVRYKTESLDGREERQLVQRAQSGDSEAFGILYDCLVDRIYRYVYFRVTDQSTAEDLTSTIFLKAWEKLGRYKMGATPFRAWLFTIAHNVVIDHYRTHKTTVALDQVGSLTSDEAQPQEQVQHRFEARALRQGLLKLTGLQQQVLTLKFLEGMQTEEIARQMGKPAGAIRALQMRGLQALTRIMEEEQPPDRS